MTFKIPRAEWVDDTLAAERGEHAGFQMFSTEANDAVAAMVVEVVEDAERRLLMRGAIIESLQAGVAKIAKDRPEVHDTEPEWAIVDAMNLWLAEHGFMAIDRDDLGG